MALPAAVEPLFLPFHHGVNDPDTVTALFLPMARLARESFALVYFDALGRLVGTRHGPLGNTDSTTLPWRRLAIDTIALDARRVVLVHNHPTWSF